VCVHEHFETKIGVRYGIQTRILKLFHRYRTFQCCVSTVDLRGPLSCPLVRRNAHNMVGTDGNAPRALTSLPLGTDLQSAVVGNPQKLTKGRPGVLRVV
jgi:hypothetical protein